MEKSLLSLEKVVEENVKENENLINTEEVKATIKGSYITLLELEELEKEDNMIDTVIIPVEFEAIKGTLRVEKNSLQLLTFESSVGEINCFICYNKYPFILTQTNILTGLQMQELCISIRKEEDIEKYNEEKIYILIMIFSPSEYREQFIQVFPEVWNNIKDNLQVFFQKIKSAIQMEEKALRDKLNIIQTKGLVVDGYQEGGIDINLLITGVEVSMEDLTNGYIETLKISDELTKQTKKIVVEDIDFEQLNNERNTDFDF